MSLKLYGSTVASRLLLGTAGYPSPKVMLDSVEASAAEILTVSLRRESSTAKSGQAFWSLIKQCNVRVLPNTAGCQTVKEAVTTAIMARELFETDWIKLEVIHDDNSLQPDVFGLVEAARILAGEGFQVFPYTTDDLSVGEQLLHAGCKVLMPWGSPIGSGRGLNDIYSLRAYRARFCNDATFIVDAGIGKPSDAARAMELGYDAVLLNTAVARAGRPVCMARAFALAVEAGRIAFDSGTIESRDMAQPSTPVIGTPFWNQ